MSRLKFRYSEQATNVWEISTVDLEILQNFEAFSEYMNFNNKLI